MARPLIFSLSRARIDSIFPSLFFPSQLCFEYHRREICIAYHHFLFSRLSRFLSFPLPPSFSPYLSLKLPQFFTLFLPLLSLVHLFIVLLIDLSFVSYSSETHFAPSSPLLAFLHLILLLLLFLFLSSSCPPVYLYYCPFALL